ncbi:amidohydrolase family protein [Massilia sp. MS-15]|uniref:amidohydrolase family protein n=1 Tax=Massilia sp. MS-15 TaxID=2878200 RepID=UPI001CD52815|nr:amidohydrolase family protein [Massilia sp. MS-15]MCA1248253.1 amidohydrolase family protein [Massilia sp. MS-15]
MRRLSVLLTATLALLPGAARAATVAGQAGASAHAVQPRAGAAMPLADHHQYVYSPAAAAFMSTTGALHPVSARDLIPQLDAAGIGRAAVLSVAYVYGQAEYAQDAEYRRVRAENDWAARQAAEYPERLVALCSVDPLKDYALAELARCAASAEFGRAIRLQPAAGGVRLDDPEQIERLQRVFRSANARGIAIVLQLSETGTSETGTSETGTREARLLIEQLLPHAPNVPVQVAYAGEREAGPQLAALAVLADAAARQDPRVRHVWIDVGAFARPGLSPADARRLVRRLRQVGMERVLVGSDAAIGSAARPRDAWAAFRRLPLSEAETARVANNVMPYLR